ncbi:hypothetical protein Cgig2_029028 [Carnegiea gigantea]|uniref:Uncharacterized protein n=1 Tax=Carnegiea gigantea TaxID=171969 RepID=A0A9Q1JVG6_9CARY|nr:hypothetical protein Cgig2_029028 [Carnegiea gigantea]
MVQLYFNFRIPLQGNSLQNWRFSINTIILPYDIEILDRQLQYLAESCWLYQGYSQLEASERNTSWEYGSMYMHLLFVVAGNQLSTVRICTLAPKRNASYANRDWDYSLNQFYGLARLVENFALSWTECNGGYPSWHPMFMFDDDASASRVKAWLHHQVRCPPRQVVAIAS